MCFFWVVTCQYRRVSKEEDLVRLDDVLQKHVDRLLVCGGVIFVCLGSLVVFDSGKS